MLKEQREVILEDLRLETIALTDGFAFNDDNILSALSRSDGKIYETLFEWGKY